MSQCCHLYSYLDKCSASCWPTTSNAKTCSSPERPSVLFCSYFNMKMSSLICHLQRLKKAFLSQLSTIDEPHCNFNRLLLTKQESEVATDTSSQITSTSFKIYIYFFIFARSATGASTEFCRYLTSGHHRYRSLIVEVGFH